MYMAELQQQLRDNGVEPKPPPVVPQGYILQSYWSQQEQQQEQQQGSWGDLSSSGLLPTSAQRERHGSQGSLLPEFRQGCIGDNYLGVSSSNDWLSPIEGTMLTLFGYKVDLAEFLPPEPEPSSDPLSYQTFLSHAFGKPEQTYKPPLPDHETCRVYSDWYFKSVQVFIPVLHKPDFMRLISRVHHGHYEPNTAETVMIHMVLAIMNFQWAVRNGDENAQTESMKHYHYSLSLVPQLIKGHKLQDIQALAMICSQLRNQPRLGAAWMFTNMVLGLAIELGLHRSANAWQGDAAERDNHVIEMRKRIFWSIMVLHVSISGKLGRPMPLRLEDFDIETPQPLNDSLPGEQHMSKWRKCSFRVSIHGMKLLKILMKTYSTIYSIRSGNESYETSVRNLEKELKTFRAQLPPELAGGPQTVEDDRCPALYLQTGENEARLLIHHPSLCRTTSPQIMSNNLDVCLDASGGLLSSARQLKEIKSLDTTWYYSTVYLAAIFTTLFAYTQRQDQMDASDLQRLRRDMEGWLDVMGDVGMMLGSGPRLREAIRGIIDTSLVSISRHLAAKTASAGLASSGSPTGPADQQQQQVFPDANGYANAYANNTTSADISNGSQPAYAIGHRGSDPTQQQNPYPQGGHFYPEPQSGSMPPYAPATIVQFDTSAYSTEDIKPNLDAQLNAHNAMTQPQVSHQQPTHATPQLTPHQPSANFMAAFQSQPASQNGFHTTTQAVAMPHSGPAAWRDFTNNMGMAMGGQDYMNSASNALIALASDKPHGLDMSAANGASMGGMHIPPDGQQPWPLIQFHPGARNGQ